MTTCGLGNLSAAYDGMRQAMFAARYRASRAEAELEELRSRIHAFATAGGEEKEAARSYLRGRGDRIPQQETATMIKRDELRDPKSCFNKAGSDEPVFVLRARDPVAAQAVRLWATIADGRHEPEKVAEAMRNADAMDAWLKDRIARAEVAAREHAKPEPTGAEPVAPLVPLIVCGRAHPQAGHIRCALGAEHPGMHSANGGMMMWDAGVGHDG